MKKILNKIGIVPVALGLIFLQACNKENSLGEDPYAGGKEPLGIVFENLNRPMASVRPGDVFEVKVRGLQKHEADVEVFLNEQIADVVSLSDSTLEVRVPSLVSSGGLKIKIRDQIYFGPRVPIEGNVRFDSDYGVKNGFNGSVNYILPGTGGNDFWILGDFSDFENQATNAVFRNNIHKITSLGESVKTAVGSFNVEKGTVGGVNTMVPLADGKYMIGGSMVGFNNNKKSYYLNRITRLNTDGSIDTTVLELINTTPEKPLNAFDTLPAFNAYLGSTINSGFTISSANHLFATPDTGVIAVGNFGLHSFIDYRYSSRESKMFVYTPVNNIVRLKSDGRIDSVFGYNNAGANGFINGAIETNDGKIVIVGAFSSFNGRPANRIVAFNKNGTINTAFNVGTGANEEIYAITYNKSRNKIALAGRFTSFNGVAKFGVVILNADGSVDDTFTLGDVEQRIPTYAYVMNNGKILVSGDFIRYNGIQRSRILILENDGTALQQYNNIGEFAGRINSVVETTSSLGHPALLIGGSFRLADSKSVGNLFKLEVRN
ncbi:DUF5008 domain-containing protein [Sphingobacterium hungaricum]